MTSGTWVHLAPPHGQYVRRGSSASQLAGAVAGGVAAAARIPYVWQGMTRLCSALGNVTDYELEDWLKRNVKHLRWTYNDIGGRRRDLRDMGKVRLAIDPVTGDVVRRLGAANVRVEAWEIIPGATYDPNIDKVPPKPKKKP